jgi:hypothetical protein
MTPLVCLLFIALGPALAQQSPDASRFLRPGGPATPGGERLRLSIAGPNITGVVVNSQGAAVPGASVVAKSRQSGVETSVQTNDKGSFVFAALPAGAYTLTTTAQGFLKDERNLNVSTVPTPPLRIELKDGKPRTFMPSVRLPALAPGTPPEQVLQELKRPSPKPVDTQIDNRLETAKNGQIVFNPPKQMQTGKDETITVRISKSLVDDLTRGLLGSGDPQSQNIKVGSEMGVTLKGPQDYFTIALLNSSEKQAITDSEATQWVFDVLPLKAGQADLILTAYVVLETPDGAEQHDYPVFARQIDITTAPKPFLPAVLEWVANNWDKLLAALVSTGLLGWIVARFKKKSNSKQRTSRRPGQHRSHP